jgi:hypothetical protein
MAKKKPAAKKATPKKKSAKKPAAKKKVNRSQLIRDYLAANPDDSPKAIVTALAKKGTKVTEALASNVKYTKSATKKKPAAKKKAGAKRQAVNDKVSLGTLVQAKKMAEQLGGVEKAKEALNALAKLQ